nr:hypothetical protein [Arthrobacter liuii]
MAAASRLRGCSQFPSSEAHEAQGHHGCPTCEGHAYGSGCQAREGLGIGKELYGDGQNCCSQGLGHNQCDDDLTPATSPGFCLVPGQQHEGHWRDGGEYNDGKRAEDHRAHQDEGEYPHDYYGHHGYHRRACRAAGVSWSQRDQVPFPATSLRRSFKAEEPHEDEIGVGTNRLEQGGGCQVRCPRQLTDKVNGGAHQWDGDGPAYHRPSNASGLLADKPREQLHNHYDGEWSQHYNHPPARESLDGQPLGVVDVRHSEGTRDEGPQPRRHVLQNVCEQ